MLQHDLQAWFDSDQDFDSGVALLEQLDPGSILIRMFRLSGATDFNCNKLEQALRDQLDPVLEAGPDLQEEGRSFPTYDPLKLPPELQRDHIQKAEYYRIAGKLREQLKVATSDRERAILAEGIMRNMQANKQCWERIDYYLEHGQVQKSHETVLPDIDSFDLARLMKEKANVASRISKLRRRIKKAVDQHKKADLEKKLDQELKLQSEVRARLDGQ